MFMERIANFRLVEFSVIHIALSNLRVFWKHSKEKMPVELPFAVVKVGDFVEIFRR